MPLLNYTTEISAETTVAEIEKALARAGASAIMKEYDPVVPVPTTLCFKLQTKHGPLTFRLPARADAALRVLNRQVDAKRIPRRYRDDRAQAIRVSWRIVKDWILAQLAIIELEQADAAELLLGFAADRQGRTLYDKLDRIAEKEGLLLGP